MNKSERAALATLLDDVAKGCTTKQTECHMLRAYLQRTQPRTRKTPAIDCAFDPAALDATRTYLAPASIPPLLIAARVHWISECGLVMTSDRMAERPEGRFRPWAYTWVALVAKVTADAPAKKAKAKR